MRGAALPPHENREATVDHRQGEVLGCERGLTQWPGRRSLCIGKPVSEFGRSASGLNQALFPVPSGLWAFREW